MKNHDNEATVYLAGLSPAVLRGTQRFLCFSIASRWSSRFRCAVIPNAELCEELGIGERQLGRLCQSLSLKGIMQYIPGRGQGNHSQFRFPELESLADESRHKGEETPTETRHKGDINPTFTPPLIRKENLNLNQNQQRDGVGLEFESGDEIVVSTGIKASSSEEPPDDDIECSSEISRILNVFESSPVTSGKSSAADRITAKRLLDLGYTAAEIEAGILLGSARKASTVSQNAPFANAGDPIAMAGLASGQVQSLAYFKHSIQEARSSNLTPTYLRYLREVVIPRCAREVDKLAKKQPERVTA